MGALIHPIKANPACKGLLSWNNESKGSTLDITTTLNDGTYYEIKEVAKTFVASNHERGMVSTIADGSFTVPYTGEYKVENGPSMTSDTNNTVVHIAFFVEGAEIISGQIERKVSVADDVGAASHFTYLTLNVGDVVDIRVKSDKAGAVISFEHITLLLEFKG